MATTADEASRPREKHMKGYQRINDKMFTKKDHHWGVAVDHVKISEVMSPSFLKYMDTIGNSQYTIDMNSNLMYINKVAGHLVMSVDQETQKEDALKIFRPQAREFAPKVNASAIITVDGPISSSTKKGTKGENLYINNVPENTTKEQLKKLFPNAADIILPVTASGTSMGYALVRIDDPALVDEVLKTSKDMKLGGNTLTVHHMVTDNAKEGEQSRPVSSSKSTQKTLSSVKTSEKKPDKKVEEKFSTDVKKTASKAAPVVKKYVSKPMPTIVKKVKEKSSPVLKKQNETYAAILKRAEQKPLPSFKKNLSDLKKLPDSKKLADSKKLPDSKSEPRQQAKNSERTTRDRPKTDNRGSQKSILGAYKPPIPSLLDKIPDASRFPMRPLNQRGDFPREGGGPMGPPDRSLLGPGPPRDVNREFSGAMPIRMQGSLGLLETPNFGQMDEPVPTISDLQMDREIVAKNLALMDDRDAIPINNDIVAARQAVARKLEQMESASTDRRSYERMDNRGRGTRTFNRKDDFQGDFDRSDNRRSTSMNKEFRDERRSRDIDRVDDRHTNRGTQDHRDNRSLLPLPMEQMNNSRQPLGNRKDEKRPPPLIANPPMVRNVDHVQSHYPGRVDEGQSNQRSMDRRNDGLENSRNTDRFEERHEDHWEYGSSNMRNLDDGRQADYSRPASGSLGRQERISERHQARRNPGQSEQRDQDTGPSAREQVLDLKKEMQAQLVKMKKEMEREMEDKLERELSKRETHRLNEVHEALTKSVGEKRKQHDFSDYSPYDDPDIKYRKMDSRWEQAQESSPQRERYGRSNGSQSRSVRTTMSHDTDSYNPSSNIAPLLKHPTSSGYSSAGSSLRKPTTGSGYSRGGDASRHTGSAITVHTTSAVPAPVETDLFARYRNQPKTSIATLLPAPDSIQWGSTSYPVQLPYPKSTSMPSATPTSKSTSLSMDYSQIRSYGTETNEVLPMQVYNYNNQSIGHTSSPVKKPSRFDPPTSDYDERRGQSSTSYSYGGEYDY